MMRTRKAWLLMLVALGGAATWLSLRGSESDPIRRDLEALARSLQVTHQPLDLAWRERLAQALTNYVAFPVTIQLESRRESSYERDALVDAWKDFAERHSALKLTLSNVGVKIDDNGERASAKGEAYLELLIASAERRGEPRRFAMTLRKSARGWHVVHVQISEPRIDQPEARP
jgi:hypothetical protein